MHAKKVPALYIVKNRNNGYVDRSILEELPVPFKVVASNILIVEEFVQQGILCDAEFDAESAECRWCKYKKNCIPDVKPNSPAQEIELSEAAINWRTGQTLVTNGKELVDSARDVFQNHAAGMPEHKFLYKVCQ